MAMESAVNPIRMYKDDRGELRVLEVEKDLPFAVHRVFWLTKCCAMRGGHSHRDSDYALFPVAGSCSVLIDNRAVVELNDPDKWLHVRPGIEVKLSDFSDDCIVMVLASGPYNRR